MTALLNPVPRPETPPLCEGETVGELLRRAQDFAEQLAALEHPRPESQERAP